MNNLIVLRESEFVQNTNDLNVDFNIHEVYQNGVVKATVGINNDKPIKYMFKDIWTVRDFLVNQTRNKPGSMKAFVDIRNKYDTYMLNAIDANNYINQFRVKRVSWSLKDLPLNTPSDFEHIILH